jgi:alpha-glucosidase
LLGLLQLPHHDGSALYVSNLAPSLGETVTVRIRVPNASRSEQVWVRTVHDAEPTFVKATIDHTMPNETWWLCRITVHNPITRYRWLLTDPQRWVTQAGVLSYDPTDANDFRLVAYAAPPSWLSDAIVYQIFPDRFARSSTADDWQKFPDWAHRSNWDDPVIESFPAAMTQMYGGDFDGVVERIDHLRSLGVNTVYSTPFFPAESNHRYNASSFDRVDPMLGGDEALIRMADALHRAGIRFIGDLTTNHSGDTHAWFRRAQADSGSPEASFYRFRSHPNDYEAWFGVPTLPKFDHRSTTLADRLINDDDSVVATYLRPPFNLDGWRVDVANMTGRLGSDDRNHDVARQLRASLSRNKPDSFLIAEHCHDASGDLDGDGWYSTMNYSGFTNPVWSWLTATGNNTPHFGSPLPLSRRSGSAVRASVDAFAAAVSWRTRVSNLNLLTSHDSVRFRSVVGNDAAMQAIGTTLLMSFPGVPSVFQGDEFGMVGNHSHVTRSPMPWNDRQRYDEQTFNHHRQTIAWRKSSPAIRHGGFRWASVDDSRLVFVREHSEQTVVVIAQREANDPTTLVEILGPLVTDPKQAQFVDALSGSVCALNDLDERTHEPGASVFELIQ